MASINSSPVRRKISVICCLLWLLACQPLATNMAPNDDDKAQIVRLTLERALLSREIPDYQLIADKSNIVLSTQNLDRVWVPELDGINFILLDSKEIQSMRPFRHVSPHPSSQGVRYWDSPVPRPNTARAPTTLGPHPQIPALQPIDDRGVHGTKSSLGDVHRRPSMPKHPM